MNKNSRKYLIVRNLENERANDNIFVKIEKEINMTLREMRRKELISEQVYHRLRTTGAQPARLCGLAKVNKTDQAMRPVLSIPGSSLRYMLTPQLKFTIC